MKRQVLSARGKIVDFDILKIKGQILNTPKNENTKNRERFIDKKRRRTHRNSIDQILAQQQQNEASVRAAMAKPKETVAAPAAPMADVSEVLDTSPEKVLPSQIIKKQ